MIELGTQEKGIKGYKTGDQKRQDKIDLGVREIGRDTKLEIRRDRQIFIDIKIERDRTGYTRDQKGQKTEEIRRDKWIISLTKRLKKIELNTREIERVRKQRLEEIAG